MHNQGANGNCQVQSATPLHITEKTETAIKDNTSALAKLEANFTRLEQFLQTLSTKVKSLDDFRLDQMELETGQNDEMTSRVNDMNR